MSSADYFTQYANGWIFQVHYLHNTYLHIPRLNTVFLYLLRTFREWETDELKLIPVWKEVNSILKSMLPEGE